MPENEFERREVGLDWIGLEFRRIGLRPGVEINELVLLMMILVLMRTIMGYYNQQVATPGSSTPVITLWLE